MKKVNGKPPQQTFLLRPLIFLALVVGFVVITRYFQMEHYFESGNLHHLIASFSLWAPLVYLIIWTIAPSFMVPVTPLIIVGGMVFGPVWGVAYVILGATVGAVVSFLIARYLAREWIVSKMIENGFLSLDQIVGEKGWKVVTLSRLIPIIPFCVVNYALGLTRVSLLIFIIGTFLGIIPLTIAYVCLSSNIADLLMGKTELFNIFYIILGFSLIIIITLFLKRRNKK
jgi:uncharacterized membrane protein YdjX (TVP38/TMEM64 family)